tara:strand:- start:3613 stop:4356 length:744 start_codon:yes stop_codon:yes gene_type:complete
MKKNDGKKKLIAGVLGGMGPLATVDFMSMVIDHCPIVTEEDHVRLLVDQNPHIPNRQIVSNNKSKKIGSMLADGAKKLESAGVDFIVMPCNTAHMFSDDVKAEINIPFIHIVEETINEITEYFPDKVSIGIMATTACINAKIYQEGLNHIGKTYLLPNNHYQDECMKGIFSIKEGPKILDPSVTLSSVANHLVDKGAEIIIAGCTEIPLVLKNKDLAVPLVSSTEVLAIKTVEYANHLTIKRNYNKE